MCRLQTCISLTRANNWLIHLINNWLYIQLVITLHFLTDLNVLTHAEHFVCGNKIKTHRNILLIWPNFSDQSLIVGHFMVTQNKICFQFYKVTCFVCARMFQTQNWFVPHIMQVAFLEKPQTALTNRV